LDSNNRAGEAIGSTTRPTCNEMVTNSRAGTTGV
jgi:hypothetical protein